MTWQTFFGADDDFAPLLEGMLGFPGAQLFEVYGYWGAQARAFTDAQHALATLPLGTDPGGHGIAVHCALWIPAVMPPPTRRRFEMGTGGSREVVEGCGLFWLQAGGHAEHSVTESTLSWFTEGAARQQCSVAPGPEAVDWAAHARVAMGLKRLLSHLAVARAQRFPVLRRALELHQTGVPLLYGLGIKRQAHVQAV